MLKTGLRDTKRKKAFDTPFSILRCHDMFLQFLKGMNSDNHVISQRFQKSSIEWIGDIDIVIGK